MAERVFALALAPEIDAPNLRRALSSEVAELVLQAWRALAQSSTDRGDYVAALTLQSALRYPYMENPDSVGVVNTARHATWVDEGRAGFHLPSRWGAGSGRWQFGKDGKRFARVPFRLSSPVSDAGGSTPSRRRQAMPHRVYSFARQLRPGDRLSWPSNEYRLSRHYGLMSRQGLNVPKRLVDVGGYTWKASQFSGAFVASNQVTQNQPRHSKYMTIRTITPDSPGWYIPPKAGQHYAERALTHVASDIERILDNAAAADLAAALEVAAGGLL